MTKHIPTITRSGTCTYLSTLSVLRGPLSVIPPSFGTLPPSEPSCETSISTEFQVKTKAGLSRPGRSTGRSELDVTSLSDCIGSAVCF
jgi:hypothetical protein